MPQSGWLTRNIFAWWKEGERKARTTMWGSQRKHSVFSLAEAQEKREILGELRQCFHKWNFIRRFQPIYHPAAVPKVSEKTPAKAKGETFQSSGGAGGGGGSRRGHGLKFLGDGDIVRWTSQETDCVLPSAKKMHFAILQTSWLLLTCYHYILLLDI